MLRFSGALAVFRVRAFAPSFTIEARVLRSASISLSNSFLDSMRVLFERGFLGLAALDGHVLQKMWSRINSKTLRLSAIVFCASTTLRCMAFARDCFAGTSTARNSFIVVSLRIADSRASMVRRSTAFIASLFARAKGNSNLA